jgi:hypothetical protein
MEKASFKKKKNYHQQIALKFKQETTILLHWSTALYDDDISTLRKVEQKYVGSFEVWCWRRMGKIS